MKVLHISGDNSAGAGLASLRLHLGLRAMGIDSRMLVLHMGEKAEEVYAYREEHKRRNRFVGNARWFLSAVSRRLRLPLSRTQRYKNRLRRLQRGSDVFFTLPFSEFDVASHPLVAEADIIHLHWVANFIDFPSFFRKIDKPVVWSLRDENPFLGGFHYSLDLKKVGAGYRALDRKLATEKAAALSRCPSLSLIFLSRMMAATFSDHPIAKNRNTFTIPNLVNHLIFRPLDQSFAREFWGLSQRKTVLCFAAIDLHDERKGLKELLEALQMNTRSDLVLLLLGQGEPPVVPNVEVVSTGRIVDERLMALAYSSADLFVMPSFQEAFAKTPLEAMACGLPVVTFPCSGTEELVIEENGIRAADFTVESLSAALEAALARTYDAATIREDVIRRFSVNTIAERHMDVYRSVL